MPIYQFMYGERGGSAQRQAGRDDGQRVCADVLSDVHAGMLASASTVFPGSLAIPAVYWWSANRTGLIIGMIVGLAVALPIERYLKGLDVEAHNNPRRALARANFAANSAWALLAILMMPDVPENQYLVLALPFAMLVTNVAATASDRRVYLAGQIPLTAGAIVAFAVFADGNTKWAAAVIAVTALTLDGLATTWRETSHRNAELQWKNECLVTDLEAANVVLQHRSEHDDLTGLPNRRALTAYINDSDASSGLGLMLIDLDSFKEVNDTQGHQFGDEILKLVASRLRSSVDDRAMLGRLGGDEFAAVWRPSPAAGQLEETAARINRELRAPFVMNGGQIHISASIGIAIGESSEDASGVLRRADVALYDAKAAGRDCAVLTLGQDAAG